MSRTNPKKKVSGIVLDDGTVLHSASDSDNGSDSGSTISQDDETFSRDGYGGGFGAVFSPADFAGQHRFYATGATFAEDELNARIGDLHSAMRLTSDEQINAKFLSCCQLSSMSIENKKLIIIIHAAKDYILSYRQVLGHEAVSISELKACVVNFFSMYEYSMQIYGTDTLFFRKSEWLVEKIAQAACNLAEQSDGFQFAAQEARFF